MSLISTIIDNVLDDFNSRERREFTYMTFDAGKYIKRKCSNIYTGSFAEGMVNFNDLDYMILENDFVVVDSIDDIPEDVDKDIGILIIDSEECNPGFARLLVHKESLRSKQSIKFSLSLCFYNGKKYLDGKRYIQLMAMELQTNQPLTNRLKLQIHGPSLTTDHVMDMAYCFPCKNNLRSTESLLKQLPSEIRNQENNVYFVAKSHEYSVYPDIEFRWSFSVIEYNLIRAFTDKEFQLYFVCKELYNTYLKSNDENKDCISSYTIKTLTFYFKERNIDKIKSTSIINLVKSFLSDMKCRIKEKYLPNYFIREHNMFDVLKDDEVKNALTNIKNVEKCLISSILNLKIFRNFKSLVSLFSVYQTVTSIDEFNIKEDILRNIIKEQSFRQSEGEVTCREALDRRMYSMAFSSFQSNIYIHNYFDILCLYFHCSSLLDKRYSADNIEKFKYLFSQFLALYLMGVAPKSHRRSLIHLLIETLLYRLIYLPNPIPLLKFNGRTSLALYYHLCQEEKKTLSLLLETSDIDIGDEMHFRVFGNLDTSIIYNDIILKKYFESYMKPLTIRLKFLNLYLLTRVLGERTLIEYIELHEKHELILDELDLFRILKENFTMLKPVKLSIEIFKKLFNRCMEEKRKIKQ